MRETTSSPPLVIHVGPWAYTVRVARSPIVWLGKARLGLASHGRREITLSPRLDPSQRLEVLLHEVRHAWGYHIRNDPGTEVEAQRFGTMAAGAMLDILAAGGLPALAAMTPAGRPRRKGVAHV